MLHDKNSADKLCHLQRFPLNLGMFFPITIMNDLRVFLRQVKRQQGVLIGGNDVVEIKLDDCQNYHLAQIEKTWRQCDQMARLFVEYLAINSQEHLPCGKSYSRFKFAPNNKHPLNVAQIFKILPKWQDITICGHSAKTQNRR